MQQNILNRHQLAFSLPDHLGGFVSPDELAATMAKHVLPRICNRLGLGNLRKDMFITVTLLARKA